MSKITRCSRFREVEIGNVGGVRTVIEAVDEPMTAIGGVPLLGKVEQRVGLAKELAARIFDFRALSAQELHANQFRLILYGIAYMLLMHLRRFIKPDLRRADANTLQKTLLIMPMMVHQTKIKRVLQISSGHAHRAVFLDTWRRLMAA